MERFLALTALTLVLAVIGSSDSSAAIVGGLAAVALAAVLLAPYTPVRTGDRTVTIGSRARAHREVLVALPSPAHPGTAGRTRARAPSPTFSAG